MTAQAARDSVEKAAATVESDSQVLECPSCGAKFRVAGRLLTADKPRRVRCSRCAHVWRAEAPSAATPPPPPAAAPPAAAPPAPEPAAPEPTAPESAAEAAGEDDELGIEFEDSASEADDEAEAPKLDDDDDDEAEDTAAPDESEGETKADDPEAEAEADRAEAAEAAAAISALSKLQQFEGVKRRELAARHAAETESLWRRSAWISLAVLLAVTATLLFAGRDWLVDRFPELAQLYRMVGMEVARPGEGLELRDVTSVRRLVDGTPVLMISGKVVNITGEPRKVPPLRAALIDGAGEERTAWTFRAEAGGLSAGSETRFETSAEDPPREGSLSLVFVEDPEG